MTLRMIWIFFGIIFTSCILSHALAFDISRDVEIHGFVSQGYMKSNENNFLADTKDGTFQFNEAGLNFNTSITDDLRMGIQFFARDLGDLGNDEITIDWAYAEYYVTQWLRLRAGRMKLPHGLYNEYRDVDIGRTNIFLPQSVYMEAWRSSFAGINGAGIHGYLFDNLTYKLAGGVMRIPVDGGMGKSLEGYELINGYVNNEESSFSTSLQWDPIEGLKLGASYFEFYTDVQGELGPKLTKLAYLPMLYPNLGLPAIPPDAKMTTETHVSVPCFSLEYTFENLIFAAEYMRPRYQFTRSMGNPGYAVYNGFLPQSDFFSEGYYASLIYRLNDYIEVGTYYSEYFPDRNDRKGEGRREKIGQPESMGWLKDFAVSLRFDIMPNWVAKLEGHIMDGTAIMFVQDNKPGNAGDLSDYDLEDDWWLFAAKLTFAF